MRVLVLAVGSNYVDSRVKVHRIDAIAAVYGVYARIVVSLDYVIASTGANLIHTGVVSANKVCAAFAEHRVRTEAAPELVGSPVARSRVVAAVTFYSLATIGGPTRPAGQRVVSPVPSDTVHAACTGEGVVAAAASNVVGPR